MITQPSTSLLPSITHQEINAIHFTKTKATSACAESGFIGRNYNRFR
jgi:hypothetical protein